MAYTIKTTGKFKKAFKVCMKRGLNPNILRTAVEILAENGKLPPEYLPHHLNGVYKGCWECHLQPDWLLIWEQYDTEMVLVMVSLKRMGPNVSEGKNSVDSL